MGFEMLQMLSLQVSQLERNFLSKKIFYPNLFFNGFYFKFFQYLTLLHLPPPPQIHCVGGCWDRTKLILYF
jgi:hypothetical protein